MSKLNSICKICGKVHLAVCQHYNEGKNPYVALVFSCPGEEEEKHGKPVYGNAGARFEQVLGMLHENNIFKWYFAKYDFRITNAYCAVVPKGSADSEWSNTAIKKQDNIDRLFEELEDTIKCNGVIICFGNRAQEAVKKMCKVKGIKPQIINTNYTGKKAAIKGFTPKVIANDIIKQIKGMTMPIKNL
jgi:uracil-DNA glycosylase